MDLSNGLDMEDGGGGGNRVGLRGEKVEDVFGLAVFG